MTLIIPLLSISGFASYFANLFKVKYTFTLPSIVSVLVFVLFLSSVAQILYYATAVIIVLGIIAQIYSLYKFPDFRKLIISFKYELSTLVVTSIFYALFTNEIHLSAWDDFGFWTIFTKELMFFNDIYPPNITTAIIPTHIYYPRGPNLIHYFILYFTNYSESKILIAHYLLQILFLAPIMANKYSWQTIILLGLLFLFPVTYGYALFSTYNDGLIGIIFSSTIMIFILSQNKHKALYLISPIIAFMPLFREIGIVLAQLAVIIIFGALWVSKGKNIKEYKKYCIYFLIGLLIIPYITHYLWFEYVAANGIIIGRKAHDFVHVARVVSSILDPDSLTVKIIYKYIKIVTDALTSRFFILIYVLQAGTCYSVYKYGTDNLRREFKVLSIMSVVGFVIFMTWRLYLYIYLDQYKLNSDVLVNTNCTIRYSTSYGVIFFAIPCAFIKITILDKFNNYNKIIASTMLFAVIILSSFLDLKKVRTKDLSANEQTLRSQTDIVRDLASRNFVINYDFIFNKIIHDGPKELVCTKIIALLVPFASNDLRKQCVNQHSSIEIEKLKINENQVISNVDLNDLDIIYDKDRCKIIYRPLINNIDISCS